MIVRPILLALAALLLVQCADPAEFAEPPLRVVQELADSAQAQMQDSYRQVVEVGNRVVGVVDTQVIAPYIANNPLLPDTVGVGFTPKYIPVRLAVDSEGNVMISSAQTIVTDIGAFDLETSKTVITQRTEPLLIIRIDDQVAVYQLPAPGDNEVFEVDFSDTYAYYRVLSFRQEQSGNIVLNLETVKYGK